MAVQSFQLHLLSRVSYLNRLLKNHFTILSPWTCLWTIQIHLQQVRAFKNSNKAESSLSYVLRNLVGTYRIWQRSTLYSRLFELFSHCDQTPNNFQGFKVGLNHFIFISGRSELFYSSNLFSLSCSYIDTYIRTCIILRIKWRNNQLEKRRHTYYTHVLYTRVRVRKYNSTCW